MQANHHPKKRKKKKRMDRYKSITGKRKPGAIAIVIIHFLTYSGK